MSVKLLTEHHLEFLSLRVGSGGSSESILVKMAHVGNLVSRLNYQFNSGIGRAIAIKLCRCGADVVAISRTQEDLDSLKEEVKFPRIF